VAPEASRIMSQPARSTSRRALLAGAAGTVAAASVAALSRPLPALAAGSDAATVTIGGTYVDVQSQTTLGNTANNQTLLWAASNSDLGFGRGTAITGYSALGIGLEGWTGGGNNIGTGVYAHSDANGVALHAKADTGRAIVAETSGVNAIYGWSSNGVAIAGVSTKPAGGTGVIGDATSSPGGVGVLGTSHDASGVRGESDTATGVTGIGAVGIHGSSASDTAVMGEAASAGAYAFKGSGRVAFIKVSGVTTISANHTSVTVKPAVTIASGSFVLLTPKANIGTRSLWFTVSASANTITIHISSVRSAATPVAWLLLG